MAEKQGMNILALDLGAATGIAVNLFGKVSANERESSVIEFYAWLCKTVGAYRMVAYEQPMKCPSIEATRQLMHREAAVRFACEAHGVPYVHPSPSEIKKHMTGKGNARKPAMITAARIRFKIKRKLTDNEADALGVLAWTMDHWEEVRQA